MTHLMNHLLLSAFLIAGLSTEALAKEPAASADKVLLTQILSMDGSVDRARFIAMLADKDLQSKMTDLLPEIERAVKVRRSTLALEADIKEIGGKLTCTPSGPQWLYRATGDTAMEIFDVPAVIDLYNGNNPLKGKGGRNERVTDEWLKRLSGVTTLRRLDLANCAVQGDGLQHIGALTGLRELNLTLTPVKDDALKHIGGLAELRILGLASTQCNGTGFQYLKGLKKLESVNFHFTPLNDEGLRAIAQVPISGRLWFAHTRFTDEGAASLKNLTHLKRCGLGSTEKGSSGEAVAALAKLPLEDLALLDNQASPVGLAHATKIATLRRLDVSHAPTVKDESMQLVAQMPALEEFKLGSAQVTDDGLLLLAASKSLKKLSLSGLKGITPMGIEKLRKAQPKWTIEVN
jgi:Leucine Rich repeat